MRTWSFAVLMTGCNRFYPDLGGEWSGECIAGGERTEVRLYDLDTDREGVVGESTGEITMFPGSMQVKWDGGWWPGGYDRIQCVDNAGCDIGGVGPVEPNFIRAEGSFPRDLGVYRVVLEGFLESRRSYEGTCWTAINEQWGTFVLERTQSTFADVGDDDSK